MAVDTKGIQRNVNIFDVNRQQGIKDANILLDFQKKLAVAMLLQMYLRENYVNSCVSLTGATQMASGYVGYQHLSQVNFK